MIPVLANDAIPIIAVSVGGAIAIISIIMGTVRSTIIGRARERTRAEVAAYVAEGSMSADEGERLLRAGAPAEKKC